MNRKQQKRIIIINLTNIIITMKKKNLFTRFKEFIVESFREYNEGIRYCIQHNLLKAIPDSYSYQIAF